MPFIRWTDALSVKVEKFDEQHKKLVGLINDLHEAMRQGKGREVIGRILDGLVDYTGYHFGAEEQAFDAFGYPEADAHKREHKGLMRTAADLQKKQREGSLLVTVETLTFLSEWVTNHIEKSDKAYASFFVGKRVV